MPNLALDERLFRTGPIESTSAGRVFPLVRLYEPALDVAAWKTYVREHCRTKPLGGVMGIEDSRGYLHGVFAWSVRRRLADLRQLRICDLMLLNLPGSALQTTLVQCFCDLARETRCRSIVVEIHEARPGVARLALETHGFRRLAEQTFAVDLGRM